MTSFNRIKIMLILSRGDRNAYQLSKMLSVEDKRMSSGTLFPILRELERDGFIVHKVNNGSKIYSLNEKGIEYVKTLENLRDDLRKKMMESYFRDNILMYEGNDYPLLLSKDFVKYVSELNNILGDEIVKIISLLLTLISRNDRESIYRIKDKIKNILEEENGIHQQG